MNIEANKKETRKSDTPLLQVDNLKTYFPIKKGFLNRVVGNVHAVDDVSFMVMPNETLAIVGESGCGKTTVARSIIRLVDPTSGKIIFDGNDITNIGQKKMRPVRKNIQLIFQDPYSSLTPQLKAGDIVQEPMINLSRMNRQERKERTEYLFDKVNLSKSDIHKYPHEFSGGQRQRIAISRALALNPQLIIADEPVSALDVSIQAQVLNLLVDIQEEFKVAYIFISHDLAVVEYISHKVAVMYLGTIVEMAATDRIFNLPRHPYTQALLRSNPSAENRRKNKERFFLEGDVPSASNPPLGCPFITRCPDKMTICGEYRPKLKEIDPDHFSACFLTV